MKPQYLPDTMNTPMTMNDETDEAEIRRLLQLSKLEMNHLVDPIPFASVTELNLSGCDLENLPRGFEDAFPNLSILFLSNNRFSEMPAVIGRCPKLQMVAFRSNGMTSIHPEALQSQLRWLIATNNHLEYLPDEIGRCHRLQKCMLSGNRLHKLPASIISCTKLELIRLASNQLKKPPIELLQLPRLAWVAFSDNPFVNNVVPSSSAHHDSLPVLTGIDETNEEILGEGAGGITRKVIYQGNPVAVKTSAGAMTSDGLPAEERRINIAVASMQNNCPGFVKVLGQTEQGSLVMEFLNGFHAIADPPTLDTCSRDVYPPDQRLTRAQSQDLLTDLLQALTFLHRGGICHGDFYGHNIMIHKEDPSNVRLTDFGAAFFFDKSDASLSALLERIELRAFAIFVEEILALIDDVVGGEGAKDCFISKLVKQCQEDGATFESVFIWWKQQQLAQMATVFGVGIDACPSNEEKE